MLVVSEGVLAFWQPFGEVVGGESADEPTWRTVQRCDGGECVQIGTLGDFVLVRNSADPYGTRLTMSRGAWQDFVASVKDGIFMASDQPGQRPFS